MHQEMKKTIRAINKMVSDGVIGGYAVGGAIAAQFYMEPFLTHDLDVFVLLPDDKRITAVLPLFDYLRKKGHTKFDKEAIVLEGVPVQFIPVHDALTLEAYRAASLKKYDGVPVRVFRPEYLMAIMLKLGRPKDKQRFSVMFETARFDKVKFGKILKKFGLTK
ncbi:MAG: hypothetical protein A2Z34_07660 [Planctomycetes bacterium RBG_16_59_8]|nr:MAG: hypothetical protein A2Z34_07660 [Planctomycetes bacterium RBG_16_59_8]